MEPCLRDGTDLREAVGLTQVPDHSTLQKAAQRRLVKGGSMPSSGRPSPRRGLANGSRLSKPRAAIDATGFESRYTSRYFSWRAGKRRRPRWWPKRTAVAETATHLFLAAHVTRGPSQDSPPFKPAARARCPLDTLLGDTAYDAEHDHAFGRDRLGIRSAVFPLNRRNSGRKKPKTEYRRQMAKRFRKKPRGSHHRRVYGQRWQVESGFRRHKRLLGSALRARIWANQKKEVLLRAIAHYRMILAA